MPESLLRIALGKIGDALLEDAQECITIVAKVGEVVHVTLEGILALRIHHASAGLGDANVDLSLIVVVFGARDEAAALERADDLGDARARERDLVGNLYGSCILSARFEIHEHAVFALRKLTDKLRGLEHDALREIDRATSEVTKRVGICYLMRAGNACHFIKPPNYSIIYA